MSGASEVREDAKARLIAAGFDLKRDHRLILDCLTPDFWWDGDDGENSGDLDEVCDSLPVHDLMRVQAAYAGPYRWAARIELDDDSDEIRTFATRDEAKEACEANALAAERRDSAS